METSDSEYFESADEDFCSDEENAQTVIQDEAETDDIQEKSASAIKVQNVVVSNEDSNKNLSENSKKSDIAPTTICNRNESTDTTTENVECKNDDNRNYIEAKEVKNSKSGESEVKPAIPKASKIGQKAKKKSQTEPAQEKDSKAEPIKVDKEEPVNVSLKQAKIIEDIVPETKVHQKDEADNLWEDDEIDWGKEEEQEQQEPIAEKSPKHTDSKPKSVQLHRENPVPQEKSKIIEDHSQEQPDPKTNTTETDQEENLWEDDEIDWGKEEGQVQEKQAPIAEPNQWEDDWEPIESKDIKPEPEASGWGGWGNWGVSTILNTATQGVSTLTNHVSHGITTVLETGIGVPDPEDLAQAHKADEEQLRMKLQEMDIKEEPKEQAQNTLGVFGLGNLVSGVSQLTKLVESTGTKVITGGLDTLETIGKKTMEVLQEGDPGLKKKRAFLKLEQNKPILSQVLREAKQKADAENTALKQNHIKPKAKNYETLFDDHQGLVHLEALEMLSKQCDIKLENLTEKSSGEALTEMQETLDQVKELCELPEEDEDEQLTVEDIKEKIETAVSEINVPITYSKLIATWSDTETWLEKLNLDLVEDTELHQQSIEALAQLTAIAVEQFHKAGELLLVKEHRSTADEADSLVQLTTSLIALIGIVAAKFSDKLNAKAKTASTKEAVNECITNVFFEASNSSSYIQDAFQLLIPVLQVGAV